MAVNINADIKDTYELPELVISLQYHPAVGKLFQSPFRTSAQEPCPRKSLLHYRPPSLYSICSARNSWLRKARNEKPSTSCKHICTVLVVNWLELDRVTRNAWRKTAHPFLRDHRYKRESRFNCRLYNMIHIFHWSAIFLKRIDLLMIVTVQIVFCLFKEAFQSLLFRYREGCSVNLEKLTKTKGEQLKVIPLK